MFILLRLRGRKGEGWETRKKKHTVLTFRHELTPLLLASFAQLGGEQLEDTAELWEKWVRALGLDGMGFPGYHLSNARAHM